MAEGKNISMSFRVSHRFKGLLEAAAASEHRSLTNMLETLLFSYCKERGIEFPCELNEKIESSTGGSKG